MKNFFKLVSASCLGTFAAVLLVFLFFTVMGLVGASKSKNVSGGTILMLDFKDALPEKTDNVADNSMSFESTSATGLRHFKKLIEHAAEDDKISGIVINTPLNSLGQAKSDALRTSLQSYADSTDKFLYAYGNFFSQNGYLLSSVADSIFLNPMGMVDLRGKATMIPFFKKAMDKLGVKMNIFYAGDFKSATEPYRRTNMSEPNREQTKQFLTEIYESMLDDIGTSRSIDEANLRSIISDQKLQTAEDALEYKIIDKISYFHEFEDFLREKLDVKIGKKLNYITIAEYAKKTSLPKSKGSIKNKIALVFAEGNINYSNDDKGQVSELNFHPILDKIKKDKNIKAIVLRVNSPGGAAFSSDEIWNELKRIKELKNIPIIASFGNYAASGGYYIAAGADTIVSEPNTLTGSIGVFSMFPNAKELFSEKLGITFDTVQTARNAVGPNIFMDLSQEQKDLFTAGTDRMYQKFMSRVAEGRGMTIDEVHQVAQGRVWTGTKAKELGLVDIVGDLDDAIEIAKSAAGLENYKLVEYPKIKKSVFKEILEGFAASSDVKLQTMDPLDRKVFEHYRSLKMLLEEPMPMARMPYIIEY